MVEAVLSRLKYLLPPPFKRLVHRCYDEKVAVVAVEMKFQNQEKNGINKERLYQILYGELFMQAACRPIITSLLGNKADQIHGYQDFQYLYKLMQEDRSCLFSR